MQHARDAARTSGVRGICLMPEPDAPTELTNLAAPESPAGPTISTQGDVPPAQAKPTGSSKQPSAESELDAQRAPSKFEAALVSVAEEKSGVAAGKGRRSNRRKATPQNS